MFFISLFISTTIVAQKREIVFQQESLSRLKQKAKTNKKLIFIDCYTTWCGPCIQLSKTVFKNDTIADFFNKNFICAKFDMEKGEGLILSKEYQIACFPTLLFLDENGNIVHRNAGFLNVKDLLQLGKDALDPEKRFSKIVKQFEENPNNDSIVNLYFDALYKSGYNVEPFAIKQLQNKRIEELLIKSNWGIFNKYIYDVDCEIFKTYENNISKFIEIYTTDSIKQKTEKSYYFSLMKSLQDSTSIVKFKQRILQSAYPFKDELILYLDFSYYYLTKNIGKSMILGEKLCDTYKKNDCDFLNFFANYYFNNTFDAIKFKRALIWAKRSVDIKKHSYNLNTYANILFTLGSKKEAIACQETAIKIAKQNKENYVDLEKNLNRFKGISEEKETDSFGNSDEVFFSLKGDIYLLNENFKSLSELSRYKPTGSIYTKKIDIPLTSFTKGFPGITNRFEWFAIEYNGLFYISDASDYYFSLLSDDGSILFIDNQLVINNDGLHPSLQIIKKTNLSKGYHQIKLQYFQGPRMYLALQLKMSKNNIDFVPFDLGMLDPLKIEENESEIRIQIRDGILFALNSAKIQENTKIILSEIKKYYINRLTYSDIIIEGYTDDIGTNEYNQILSQKRANSIASYFVSEGLSKQKVKTIGYGKKKPIVENNSDENRAKNRRVEIRIIK
jgi:outer membrane protein OmpA-like peptidoglycan-associated protein/thioredoxin-related protein